MKRMQLILKYNFTKVLGTIEKDAKYQAMLYLLEFLISLGMIYSSNTISIFNMFTNFPVVAQCQRFLNLRMHII